MGKGKALPAVDFHAVVARRDPALADRLAREGITPAIDNDVLAAPALVAVPPPPPPVELQPSTDGAGEPSTRGRGRGAVRAKPERKRGIVARAGGRDAGRITVYVPSTLALRLRQYCFERDRSMTDVAGEVLVAALEQRLRAD